MNAIRGRMSRRVTGLTLASGVVVLGLALPIVCIIVSRSDRSTGDIALIELRTRDVLSAHPPVLGAYSRYGWSHPGPFMFYLFAIPFRLLGNDATALRWTVLLFNSAVIVLMLWLASRRGLAAWLVVAAATVALTWGLLPHSLSDGWNVTVAILPFLLTLVACWCALCGDRWALLVAVLSFSFVFQAHIGFGLVLVPLVAVTLVWRAVRAWPRSSWAPQTADDGADDADGDVVGRRIVPGHAVLGTLAVIVVFVPVIYDSLARWPGNLGRLAKWSMTNDEPKVGVVDGLRIVGRTSSLSFLAHPQFPGRFVLTIDSVSTGFLPWTAVVLLIAAAVVAVRARYRAEALLCLCVGLVWAAGAVAAANIAEPLLPWLIDWLQPLGWLTWGTVVLVAWRAVQASLRQRADWPRLRSIAGPLVGGVLGVVFVIGTIGYANSNVTTNYLSADAVSAVDELSRGAATVGSEAPIVIVSEGDPLAAGTMMNGVVNQLDRQGFDLCVDPSLAHQFGDGRVCTGTQGQYLMVRSEEFEIPAPAGAQTLAISDPLSPEQRVEADAISEQLAAILIANDRDDEVYLLYSPLAGLVLENDPPAELTEQADAVRRLSELRQVPGTRYGLYLVRS